MKGNVGREPNEQVIETGVPLSCMMYLYWWVQVFRLRLLLLARNLGPCGIVYPCTRQIEVDTA